MKRRSRKRPFAPRKRHVFGRRRWQNGVNCYVVELHPDGIHVRKLYGKDTRRVLPLSKLVSLSDCQLHLISAPGEGLPELAQSSDGKPLKERNQTHVCANEES